MLWKKKKPTRYSELGIKEIITNYLELLKNGEAKVLSLLNNGTEKIEFEAFRKFDLILPQDLLDFWGIVNGLRPNIEAMTEDTWLDGTFTYFSCDESLIDYKAWENARNQNPETMKDYMPEGFLPIGSPGEGSRILINCREGSPTHGHVYELLHADGLSRHSESLTQYFRTILMAMSGKELYLKNGIVEVNYTKFSKIAAVMNPGCSAYYNIPQSCDWLSEGEI